MFRMSIKGIALFALIFTALALGVSQPADAGTSVAPAASVVECDSSSEPCLRIYKTAKDVESQTYTVVKFTEVEVTRALFADVRRIHYRIKDETGFDCKSGEYKYGVFRCEEGGIATRYEQLIQALDALY